MSAEVIRLEEARGMRRPHALAGTGSGMVASMTRSGALERDLSESGLLPGAQMLTNAIDSILSAPGVVARKGSPVWDACRRIALVAAELQVLERMKMKG